MNGRLHIHRRRRNFGGGGKYPLVFFVLKSNLDNEGVLLG